MTTTMNISKLNWTTRPTPTPGCIRLGMDNSFMQHSYIWAEDKEWPDI